MNPPVPTALRILRGNPGHRPLPENEPEPPVGATMPEGMTQEAQKQWGLVSRHLEDAGVLTVMDAMALALFCEAYARWKSAQEKIDQFGLVVKAPSGFPVQSPYLAIANKAHEQMVKLLMEFGMTPSSRTRVKTAPGAKTKTRSRLRSALSGDD